MAPIEYIPIMQAYYERQGLGPYPLYHPTDTPWTPLAKPLAECRIALVASAGISRCDQKPFRRHGHDDFSIREVPLDSPADALVVNYDYFNHADADKDMNCLFPLARLRELAKEGFVGGACPTAFAMGIGRWREAATPERLQTEVAGELFGRCREQEADAVLLVPG